MNGATPQYGHPEIWRPLTGMPEGAHTWRVPGYGELSEEWASIRARIFHYISINYEILSPESGINFGQRAQKLEE